MNKIKIEFGFGVQIKGDGSLLTHEERVIGLARIRKAAVDYFGGCTLYHTDGDWRDDESGTIYSEPGVTLSIITTSAPHYIQERVKIVAETIKVRLFQRAVYVTRHPVQSELY